MSQQNISSVPHPKVTLSTLCVAESTDSCTRTHTVKANRSLDFIKLVYKLSPFLPEGCSRHAGIPRYLGLPGRSLELIPSALRLPHPRLHERENLPATHTLPTIQFYSNSATTSQDRMRPDIEKKLIRAKRASFYDRKNKTSIIQP